MLHGCSLFRTLINIKKTPLSPVRFQDYDKPIKR